MRGLEPPRLTAPEPKSGASTSSATSARFDGASRRAGINRQRKGNVMASDKVGSTERAVFQSSVMTEELFRKYEEFESLEVLGLLNVAQIAWKDGKHGMYVTSNQQQVFYEIDDMHVSQVILDMVSHINEN